MFFAESIPIEGVCSVYSRYKGWGWTTLRPMGSMFRPENHRSLQLQFARGLQDGEVWSWTIISRSHIVPHWNCYPKPKQRSWDVLMMSWSILIPRDPISQMELEKPCNRLEDEGACLSPAPRSTFVLNTRKSNCCCSFFQRLIAVYIYVDLYI